MKKLYRKVLNLLGLRPAPRFTVEAKVIRADGTVEDLGVVGKGRVKFETEAG